MLGDALLFSLTMSLTSCEDVLGHWEKPTPTPITPTVEEVIKYGFKVTDLIGTDRTEAVTSLKMSNEDGTLVVGAEVSADHKITIKNTDLTAASITAAADFWFEAEIGGEPYVAKVTIDPTKLSPETPKTLAMATVGDVITSDGTFATKGASGEQAVLAYIGKVDNYFDRFLAIALEDTGDKINWASALAAVNTYAGSHAITIGGTTYNTGTTGDTYYDQVADNESTSSATATALQQGWRLPSVTDWRYIFAGLCGLASPAPDAGGVKDGMVYGTGSTLLGAINTACGNTALISDTNGYWSSSDLYTNSNSAWYYRFYDSLFYWSYAKSVNKHVRAVFAY